MAVPPLVVLAVGTIGAAVIVRLVVKEWQRVQDELARARTAPVSATQRAAIPRLRRDPLTGVYRPSRD